MNETDEQKAQVLVDLILDPLVRNQDNHLLLWAYGWQTREGRDDVRYAISNALAQKYPDPPAQTIAVLTQMNYLYEVDIQP